MWTTVFWVFAVSLLEIAGSFDLQPTVITELHNAFNNLSNLALMPELMQTAECRRDCEIYRNAFVRNEMWAMEMFDANGRLSSGILKGNMQQKGNIRECIHVSNEKLKVNGKFCFGKIYIEAMHNSTSFDEIYDRMLSNVIARLEPYVDAVGPAMNTILHGLCVPSSCTVTDLTFASRKILSFYNHSKFDMIIHFDNMKDRNCIIKEEFMVETVFTRAIKDFFIVMSILVFAATLADFFLFNDAQRVAYKRVVIITRSFSLVQNWKILFNAENESTFLPWLNGAKCILYFFMFTAHYSFRLVVFTADRWDVYELLRNPYVGCLARNALLILDFLVLLNGISHSYKLIKLVEQNKIASMVKSILSRYLRLSIFILAFLCIEFSVIHKNEAMMLYTPKKNKLNIWSIIFCYENFAGLDNMFFAPTHTFFTDIQLYVFGCILLMIVKKRQNKFKIFFALIFLTLLFRSIFLYFKSNVIAFMMFGMNVEQFIDMLTYIYTTPFSRLSFYIAGLGLGYYTQQNIENYNMPLMVRKIGWIVAFYCVYTVAFCYYSFDFDYKYNNFDGAKVSFIHSFCAIFSSTWLLWNCHLFKDAPVNKFLSAKVFIVLNRLIPYFSSLHLIVLFYSVGGQRAQSEFTLIGLFGLDYMFFTVFLCIFIMLFVHLPLKNLWRVLTQTNGDNTKKD